MTTQGRLRPRRLVAVGGLAVSLAMGGILAATAAARSAAAPRNVTPPAITGVARDGSLLATSNGTWENTPTSFAYQWQRCSPTGESCVNIIGATRRAYRATTADVDHTLRSIVTASNLDGKASATSKPTELVSANTEPRNRTRPSITGTPQVGEELTADPGTWTGGVRSFAYQWERCDTSGANCIDVPNANGKAYGVRMADVGHTMRVQVTATNLAGSESSTSDRTGVVRSNVSPPPPPPPPPTGGNARPTLVILSVKWQGNRLYARVRICDDSRRNVTILERESKLGLISATRKFGTAVPPRNCGVYSRNWLPAKAFRTASKITVTLWARDAFKATSTPKRKTVFR